MGRDVVLRQSGILFSLEINEIWPVVTTPEELRMIFLSDRIQKEKDTYHKISLKGGIQNGYT